MLDLEPAIFGVWPGVVAADLVDFTPIACPPEDPEQTLDALRRLQSGAAPFYVRCYRHFGEGVGEHAGSLRTAPTPGDPGKYVGQGRLVDLVLCYQSPRPDPDGFASFVRHAVRDVATWGGGKVQVGEELNVAAPLDGGCPGCFEAVAAGVAAAFDERERLGVPVKIGVNSAGMADLAFWARLTAALGARLTRELDYVGLDMFPDVFRPVPQDRLGGAVSFVLDRFRDVTLQAGIPADTPVHITETGWPTGPERTEADQATVLTEVAETVLASEHHIVAYEWFGLRDVLSTATWSARFGILRDDYTPKLAFTALRDLIQRSQA